MKKALLILLGLVLMTAGIGFAYLELRSPNIAPPADIKVEITPERLERGRYIFENLADCTGCHSEHDMKKFAAPVLPGRTGSGQVFPKELGFPGSVVAPNLTPDPETGLGKWTDGEKIRAIREGISRDGRALFPFMPYGSFRQMSDEDVYSVVAYLNSLPPVRNQLSRTTLDFPVNLLIKSAPQPVLTPVAKPDKTNSVKYGEYLAKMSGCGHCHTQQEKGELKEDLLFAGGFEFRVPGFSVFSANITPEMETGIGNWSEERFIEKFRGYGNFTPENIPIVTQANFTLMPWLGYAKLQEEDLRAIYRFLRTVKPIRNNVESHKQLIAN